MVIIPTAAVVAINLVVAEEVFPGQLAKAEMVAHIR
jgi:hypothetical protein